MLPNDPLLSSIVNTVRESMLVLDSDLRVVFANDTFLAKFQLSSEEIAGRFVYQVGNGEWNIPALRVLLSEVLPRQSVVDDFAIDHSFERIGRRHLLLNARVLRQAPGAAGLILLAIEDVSEGNEAQRQALLNRELLRATLASIGDGVITTDQNGAVLTLNPVAQVLTGWTEDDAKGKPLTQIFSIINEQSGEAVSNPALRALAEGRIMGLANHTLLIAKDGTVRSIDDSAAPIRDADGTLVGSVLVFRDISAQRELERERERLRESEIALLASTAEGIYSIDEKGCCTSINRAALDMLGYSEEECMGRNMHQLIHSQRADGAPLAEKDCRIYKVLKTSEALQEQDDVFWRKDGSGVPVSLSCAPILIRGAREGAVIAFSDRSERNRLDKERHDATERLRLVMEAARMMTWTWQPDKNQIVTSDNLPTLYGVDSIGSLDAAINLVVPEDRRRHRRTVLQAAANKTGYHSEFRIIRPDSGQVIWLDERCVCTETGDPPVTSFTGITLDVTEKRLNQKLLEEAHTRLEETALELRRSNEDLGQFAAIAGHDLQSPLRTISAFSQLLNKKLKDTPDAEVTEYLDFISSAAGDMKALISSLLDYARVGGALQTDSVVHLDGELRRMLATIQELVNESQAEVTLDPLPAIHGNAVQFRQLFQNLIVNAITYRHPLRKPVIHVGVVDDPVHWTFFVQDNGLGIAKEHLDLIFTPFKRLHGAERPGSGLGLAVCKRIVANYRGQITVESTPDVGSRFSIRLPKATSAKVE